ncbi:hypothetical protein KP803_09640 [Vibrio sp. ZSDE26]|uniref:MaoC-like domain-containing protein n=1 Tax=Vibrio amylolyticus TaxID=2847292 RepID=A0A9X1XHZ1_9VIBR|nr:MaoC/PaaZ C-terminal domain-containing protein [Vibrio amylolyticus]MCK6263532.1 hypothetical protein [Vibrio amylolyticus]
MSTLPDYRPLLCKALFKGRKGNELKPFSLSIEHFSFQCDHIAMYRHFFNIRDKNFPLPYLFVATQAAQLYLFTHPDIAIRPLGLVHTGIELDCFEYIDETLEFSFNLALSAQSDTERGKAFELTGSLLFENNVIAQYRSQYLIPNRNKKIKRSSTQEQEEAKSGKDLNWGSISVNDARRYAKLSKDYNPIHLSHVLSRLFGFKQPIAHGMYMVGKLYEKATVKTTERDKANSNQHLKVAFCRPLLLPSPMYFRDQNDSLSLLNQKQKLCVEMTIRKGES